MFPLQTKYQWPGTKGAFGSVRKHDIHTGVDLYCEPGSSVVAIEDGRVVKIEDFTGAAAGSPWWNDTKAVLVLGASGVVCYGEIEPRVRYSDYVKEGQQIGVVRTVLKKNKGLPMTMLHFELYERWVRNTVVWELGKDKPEGLKDPTWLLKELRDEVSAKDLLGQPIRVGDLVANCVLQYRSAAMRLGVVKSVDGRHVNIFRASGRSGTTAPHDIVVIRWDQLTPEHESYQKLIDMRDSLAV